MTEITYGQALAIEGYGPGFFRVGTHVLRGACFVTPWDAGAWGGMDDSATPLSLLGRIDVLLKGPDNAHVIIAARWAYYFDGPYGSGNNEKENFDTGDSQKNEAL